MNEITELTATEKIVARFIANGFSEKQIADKMFLSVHTVHTHARNLRKKLNANNIADVTRKYILSLDDPKKVLISIILVILQLGNVVINDNLQMRRPRSVQIRTEIVRKNMEL